MQLVCRVQRWNAACPRAVFIVTLLSACAPAASAPLTREIEVDLNVELPLTAPGTWRAGLDDCNRAQAPGCPEDMDHDGDEGGSSLLDTPPQNTDGARTTIPVSSSKFSPDVEEKVTIPTTEQDVLKSEEKFTRIREALAVSARLFQRAVFRATRNKPIIKYECKDPQGQTIRCTGKQIYSIMLPDSALAVLPVDSFQLTCNSSQANLTCKLSLEIPLFTEDMSHLNPGQLQQARLTQARLYSHADQVLAFAEQYYPEAVLLTAERPAVDKRSP